MLSLYSNISVCVCVVYLLVVSTGSWTSRYGIFQSSSSKVEPVRLTLLTCSRRPQTHRLTEGGGLRGIAAVTGEGVEMKQVSAQESSQYIIHCSPNVGAHSPRSCQYAILYTVASTHVAVPARPVLPAANTYRPGGGGGGSGGIATV